MRSLFLRLFVAFWLAMMVIGAAFAVIYSVTIPELRVQRFQRLISQAVHLRGEHAARCLAESEPAACGEELRQLSEDSGLSLALYRDGTRLLGDVPYPVVPELVARVAAGEPEARRTEEDRDVVALPVDGGRFVVVGARTRTPRWLRFVSPETLPQRLLVLLAVTGLVSLLLARYLSRPMRTLRRAAQRIAEGDLSVRVLPELEAGDRETAALARDFDRMAQRIEELLETERRLLRDVSHELRSPLARLSVALGLARQRSGPEAARALERIEREAERLGELIGQVLTVARLEADAEPRHVEELALDELVEEVSRDVEFEVSGRARVVLDPLPPLTITGNPEVLRRAIENVLRNAVRFTKEGSEVQVALTESDGAVELRVRDRGAGVPEEALKDIFRPFFRVDSDRDRNTGGTGVGLAIAERAVALHGGSVRAENADGGGLLVSLRLPLSARN